jgi:hypothetical protein
MKEAAAAVAAGPQQETLSFALREESPPFNAEKPSKPARTAKSSDPLL